MKFMHISDLHLGKRVNGFSMLEDQKDILRKILKIADEEKPQALLIAGDVYDKSIRWRRSSFLMIFCVSCRREKCRYLL